MEKIISGVGMGIFLLIFLLIIGHVSGLVAEIAVVGSLIIMK